ncbi:hypothetical protein CEXT_447051 [Caerostris extrusa]|uniref:Uncharacterized protein n=1 Tax=Caerostris extrusa TaxID=172846 RepID=A0AAV4N981_CAEEX|nr:hypothetical protein CEXT_447051 [Caerostris extrusa]
MENQESRVTNFDASKFMEDYNNQENKQLTEFSYGITDSDSYALNSNPIPHQIFRSGIINHCNELRRRNIQVKLLAH